MGALTVNLPDDLETQFRRRSRERFGDKQGKLSKAAVEALEEWIKKEGECR